MSRAVSPLLVDEVEASKFSTSAPRRCAASWKLECACAWRVRRTACTPCARPARGAATYRRWRVGEVPARGRAGASSTSRGRPSSVRRWRRRPCASTWAAVTRRLRRDVSVVGWHRAGRHVVDADARRRGAASQRSTMTAAATASSAAASRRLLAAFGAVGGEALRGFDRTGALVDQHHRQAIARAQFARESVRARWRIGWSPPSSVIGSPTTSPSGRHSARRRSIAVQSGPCACTSITAELRVRRCRTQLPTATPMRRAPTSKPEHRAIEFHRVMRARLLSASCARSTPMLPAAACQRASSGVSNSRPGRPARSASCSRSVRVRAGPRPSPRSPARRRRASDLRRAAIASRMSREVVTYERLADRAASNPNRIAAVVQHEAALGMHRAAGQHDLAAQVVVRRCRCPSARSTSPRVYSDGRLTTMPIAPSASCWHTSATLRAKCGSASAGSAISKRLASGVGLASMGGDSTPGFGQWSRPTLRSGFPLSRK